MITVPTFFNEPKTASQAAFITRIMDRADRLFTEGYYAYRCANGTFGVYQSGTDKAYSVNLET